MNKQIPKLRFKDFNDEWQSEKLNKVVKRVTRKNKNLESTLPLTISAQYGLINQTKFFNKQIASDKLENYFLLKKGEFAYNKSYSKDAPWGAIKRLNNYDNGVLSTLYILFKPININSDFLQYFFNSSKWYKNISQIATEGARNHGLLNVSPIDFFNIKIKTPLNLEEQRKIGQFFNKLDNLISLHTQQLELLKNKRDAYLQKLFPQENAKMPRLRFKGFNDKWQSKKLKELGNILTGNTPSTKYPNFYSDNGTLWVTPSDINSNIITNTQKKLSPEGLKHARVVPANSLLITCIASIGKNAITYQQVAFNQQINALIPNKNNNPYFLLTSSHFWSQKMQNLTNAGMMAIFNKTDFSNLTVKIPDLKEQYQVGSFFNKLDQLITLQEHKIELLEQKKQAYLQKMFI